MTEHDEETTPIDNILLSRFMQTATADEWTFFLALPDTMEADRKLCLLERFRTEYNDYREECAYFDARNEVVSFRGNQ